MVTKILIFLNIGVFIAMCLAGASPLEPSVESIALWGGIRADLIAGGEWWRLLSSMFVHIGVVHLGMNLYFLYSIGSFVERIVGRMHFLICYFATGVLAGLGSYFAHRETLIVSAGASGAIAGIFGVYIFVLLTPLIHSEMRRKLLKNVAQIIGINVIYGISRGAGIDHAAHIGGLTSGFIIGGAFYLCLRGGFGTLNFRRYMSGGMVLLIPILLVPTLLKNETPSDFVKYIGLVEKYSDREKTINEMLGGSFDKEALFSELEKVKWISKQMKELQLKEKEEKARDIIVHYLDCYDARLRLVIKANEMNTYIYNKQIQDLSDTMDSLIQEYTTM